MNKEIIKNIEKLILEGDLKEAIALFQKSKSFSLFSLLPFQLILSKFNRLEKENRLGVVSREDYSRELNKINVDFIKLLKTPFFHKYNLKLFIATGLLILLSLIVFDLLSDTKVVLYGKIKNHHGSALNEVEIKLLDLPGYVCYSDSNGEFSFLINEKLRKVSPIQFNLSGYKPVNDYLRINSKEDSVYKVIVLDEIPIEAFFKEDEFLKAALDSAKYQIIRNQFKGVVELANRYFAELSSAAEIDEKNKEYFEIRFNEIIIQYEAIGRGFPNDNNVQIYIELGTLATYKNISDVYDKYLTYLKIKKEISSNEYIHTRNEFSEVSKSANIHIDKLAQLLKHNENADSIINYWEMLL